MKVLRELREKRGLTLEQVAEALNLRNQYVSNYELGKRRPDYDTLSRFADFYHVSVDYLLGRTDEKAPLTVAESKLSEEAKRVAKAFEKAQPELKAMVEWALNVGEAPTQGAIEIKVTCPLDGREQVIYQPYYVYNGKRRPDRNNGCENCHKCPECDECMLKAMAQVLD